MADLSQSNWSETDANNNTAAPDGAPEGMAPSGVNDTIRAVMGAIKRFWNQINGTLTSGGSANAQTLSYGVAPAAYVAGMRFLAKLGFTSTTTGPTLNVNALGAKTVKQPDGSALTFGGELLLNAYQEFVYDGASMVLRGLPWKSGAWTPTLSLTSGSATYSLQSGYYFRLGPIVFFEGALNLATVSGAGGATGFIAGLPYAAAVTTYGHSCEVGGFNYNAYVNVGTAITTQIGATATSMLMQVIEHNGTVSILGAGLGNNSGFSFSGIYFTAAPL